MVNAKRFWALFLALAMTLAMFPATVFANDDEGYDEGTEGSDSIVATFDANGGAFSDDVTTIPIETDYDGSVNSPNEDPTKDGYIFVGWSYYPEQGSGTTSFYWYDENEEYQTLKITENTTFYAQWEEAWTVTFDANGGYFVDPEEGTVTESVVQFCKKEEKNCTGPAENPEKDDFGFIGWSTKREGGEVITFNEDPYFAHTVYEDTVFYAQWGAEVAVTFDSNGGYFLGEYAEFATDGKYSVTATAGQETWNYPYVEHNENYIFAGWYIDDDEQLIDTFEEGFYVVDEATTFKAKWVEAYTITFNANGGFFEEDTGEGYERLESKVKKISCGNTTDFDETPRHDGNLFFAGWSESPDGGIIEDFEDHVPQSNTTYYAQWESGWKVTLKADKNNEGMRFLKEESVIEEVSFYVKKGASIEISMESANPEYGIVGWIRDDDEEFEDEWLNAEITRDTVFYAKWAATFEYLVDPGEGRLPYSEELGVSETRRLAFGTNLNYYAGNSVAVNGETIRIFETSREEDTDPKYKDESKVFDRWYLDEAKTKPVPKDFIVDEDTYESLEKDDQGRLCLYAGYSDFNTVTIHPNGAQGDEDFSIKAPEGMAIDLSSCGISSPEEDMVLAGWFTDSDHNTVAEIIRYEEEDDYKLLFIPSEDVDLYPAWREYRGSVDLYLDVPDVRFYTDDEAYSINVNFDKEKPDAPIGIRYKLELFDASDNSFAKALDNEEKQYFTINELGGDVILNGHAIKAAAEESNIEDYLVKLTVEAVDEETEEVLATDNVSCKLVEPYTDYFFIRNDDEDEEEADEEDFDDSLLVGKNYIIRTYGYGNNYSSKTPDGEEEFSYNLEGVEEVDGNLFKITENWEEEGDYFESYKLIPTAAGTSKLRFSLVNEEGKRWTETITVKVVDEKYTVKLEPANGTDVTFLRTQSFALKATGLKKTAAGTSTDADFSYEWEIDPEWEHADLNVARVTPREDTSLADFEYSGVDGFIDEVPVKVTLKKDGRIRATSVLKLDPRESYYKVKEPANFNKKLAVGKSIKITPEVWYYSCENPSGENVTNSIKYLLCYDGVNVTGSNNKEIPNMEDVPYSAEEQEYDGEFYKGSFTIKRNNGDSAWVNLHIYDANGNWQSVHDFEFDSLKSIDDELWVDDIPAKTFTGKQIKPALEIENWSDLREGRDYTISYGTNINAGTGTVTITGIGEYWGTIKKTFKINPKKITPTVTLSKTSFTYNGKVQKPKVTVKNGNAILATSNYTLTYSKGLKNVGAYTVTVKMKGNFSGSKSATYNILPKGTSLKKVAGAPKAFTATWGKQTAKMASARITGYQIQYSLKKNFKSVNKTVTVKGYKAGSKKVAKLKAKKTYYVRIRTYTKVGKKTLYSTWSKAKAVKTK